MDPADRADIRVGPRQRARTPEGLDGPVVFAANHQSHLDVPVILAAMPGAWRARTAPAMAKEFFKAHFFPEQHSTGQVITNRLNYYLAAFFFNAFPLPQREAGARQTLRYIGEVTGDGFSVLIFPEGVRSSTGEIRPFRGGIGMIASRLQIPVVPVRLEGVDRVLHHLLENGAARPLFGDLRGADAPDGGRLRRSGQAGGGSGSPFACGARSVTQCRCSQLQPPAFSWRTGLWLIAESRQQS